MTMRCTIGEINILCTDTHRSLAFYRDVLGFEVLAQEEDAYHLRCGEIGFLLLAVADAARPLLPYCATPEFSIDLLVEDLNATYAHLQSHQVTFVSEREPNRNRFFIRDPDGLVFEVIQRAS
ncbi:MAG TPA: VOC family protein [Chthonomonadaceae bacterium]|nr:VOC family protein [Chthonomonadaceae bacterium]